MSPLHSAPEHDRSNGVEAVFAGQVDTDTARAADVLLWDDDAILQRLLPTVDDEVDSAA